MVNKVILIGNVGANPEVGTLENGAVVGNMRLATTESYKNKNGEKVEQTEWHNIVLWNSLAKITENYVKKGTKVYIEGKIRTRSWEDKNGGKRYTTEIYADTMRILSASQPSESHLPPNTPDPGKEDTEREKHHSEESDDLPF